MKRMILASSLAVVMFSACGGDDATSSSTDVEIVAGPGQGGAAESDSESSAPTATDAAETTTTTTLVPSRNTLAGVWRASAQDILSANLANLGGLPMNCVGEIEMTLSADGSFSRDGSMECTIDDVLVSGQFVNSSGTWEADNDTITVTITESDGYAQSIGPGGDAQRVALPDNGYSSAAYDVTATTLSITFTDPSVGRVTQRYTRG